MESNGKPGKIHVSPTTAACLTKSGKGRWLIPREDTINAKGIGEMKTYWVKVPSSLSRHSSMDSSYDYETGSQYGNNMATSSSVGGSSFKEGIEVGVAKDDDVNNNNINDGHHSNITHQQVDTDDVGSSWSPGLEMGHPNDDDEPYADYTDYTTSLDEGGGTSAAPAPGATTTTTYDVITNARLIQQQNHVARTVGKKVPPPKSTMEHMLTM